MKVKLLLVLSLLAIGTISFGQNKIPYSSQEDKFDLEKNLNGKFQNKVGKDFIDQVNKEYLQKDADIKPANWKMPILIPESKHTMPIGNIPENVEFKMPVLEIKELK